MKKRCIVHIPWKLLDVSVSATEIRPFRMRQAFQDLGYDVCFIMGDVKTRKLQIAELKKQIQQGAVFDFMYSESSTLPMMLTESHHLPTHPFVDLSLFRLCRRHSIPIGLFYRDLYWAYPSVKRFRGWKQHISLFFHQLDIRIYNYYASCLFFPTPVQDVLYQKIPSLDQKIPLYDLMPGTTDLAFHRSESNGYFVAMGGIDLTTSNISVILNVFRRNPQLKLIVCTPSQAWEKAKSVLEPLLADNIEIRHDVNEQAQALIRDAAYTLCYFPDHEYRSIAMPFKYFDYLSHRKPVICNRNDYAGQMTTQHHLGFAIPHGERELEELLHHLPAEAEYQSLITTIDSFAKEQTWQKRAEKVRDSLICHKTGTAK